MNTTTEPVAIAGGVMAVISTGFGLAVLLGVPLTETQVGGFIAFFGAVIALVTLWQRSRVQPIGAARRAAPPEES